MMSISSCGSSLRSSRPAGGIVCVWAERRDDHPNQVLWRASTRMPPPAQARVEVVSLDLTTDEASKVRRLRHRRDGGRHVRADRRCRPLRGALPADRDLGYRAGFLHARAGAVAARWPGAAAGVRRGSVAEHGPAGPAPAGACRRCVDRSHRRPAPHGCSRRPHERPLVDSVFSSPKARRDLMGQVDGTADLPPEDPRHDQVLSSAETQPEWLRGGSYVAVRRIRIDLDAWNSQSVEQQEAVIGRLQGLQHPLNGTEETDPVDLSARPSGGVRDAVDRSRAAVEPDNTRGAPDPAPLLLLRRRCRSAPVCSSWPGGPIRAPASVAHPSPARCGGCADAFTVAEGGALFACFPGCQPGGYVGETVLEA